MKGLLVIHFIQSLGEPASTSIDSKIMTASAASSALTRVFLPTILCMPRHVSFVDNRVICEVIKQLKFY